MILIPGRLDLTGNTYGDFTVIEMLYGYKNSETSKPRTYCKCLGTDDNEYIIRADALQRGVTRHLSGVGKGRSIDISGQKFGHLVAIHPTSKRTSNGSVVWCCQCDCGNTVEVQYGSLKRGHTRSCGCNKRSKWEEFIHDYLTSLNISFEEEKRFSDCKNQSKSDMLPFDFYLPSYNLLIEYDGIHHYEPIPGWGGEEKFLLTQRNDSIKNEYCKQKGISLLRIPYFYEKEDIINAINQYMSPVTITA